MLPCRLKEIVDPAVHDRCEPTPRAGRSFSYRTVRHLPAGFARIPAAPSAWWAGLVTFLRPSRASMAGVLPADTCGAGPRRVPRPNTTRP